MRHRPTNEALNNFSTQWRVRCRLLKGKTAYCVTDNLLFNPGRQIKLRRHLGGVWVLETDQQDSRVVTWVVLET